MKKLLLYILLPILVLGALACGLTAYRYLPVLERDISSKFDGQKWSLPAAVYARPLEIYPGLRLSPNLFEQELLLGGYRAESNVSSSGGYSRSGSSFQLITRPFTYPDGKEPSVNIEVLFEGDTISSIRNAQGRADLPFVRIDPPRIGSFHPLEHEDRLVLVSTDIPQILIDSLIAVEDRNFYSHHGISIKGISRALLANIKAGKTVQGGSTISQQLVKNLFLSRDQTLRRKVREAVMAILLEKKYSKEEILTAYINEIFLGQDGSRAIHGFGLASQYFFRRDIRDLSVAQVATLVGMVKGPSGYNPVRHPERSLARRQQVLEILKDQGVIDDTALTAALAAPLTDVAPQKIGLNRFPAFLDLVKRQLKSEYREEDLNSSGLQILTTLDPLTQVRIESEFATAIESLEQSKGITDLEGSVIMTSRDNGEVQAVCGGKRPGYSGFNRALDAKRQIGSLVKPAVYLTAIEKGYTLSSPLLDAGISLESDGKKWRPRNYDLKEHGTVPFYLALAKSYNLATVRLGLSVGLDNVIQTIHRLGYTEKIENFPSLLLGGVSMTPMQITQIYQTIGSGGFYQPLRSIRSVMNSQGKLVNRYGLEVEQRFGTAETFLLTHCLQRVMEEGTGRRLARDDDRVYAGKTGTSDGLRDSWFAGLSTNRLAVVWLGRDDNTPISLTGSTGALQAWGRIMNSLEVPPDALVEPQGIVWHRIDNQTLRETNIFNRNSTKLPFLAGHEPATPRTARKPSSNQVQEIEKNIEKVEKEARKLFKSINDLFQ